jgi:copper chaperone CopZ
MKNSLIITAVALVAALTPTLRAESTVTVSGVHNCCKSCESGITKAVGSVKNASASISGRNVTITVKNKSDSKKAVAALLGAGYFGTAEGVAEKSGSASSSSAAKETKKVKSVTVTGLHLCCQKCADAAQAAIKDVPGVTSNTIASKVSSFTVSGEFEPKALETALNTAGFNGKVK